ncbi:Glyoxalase/Bleomycin resistance protein/Dihydroxybiphenyl dioxygenase [Fimicolochytrium jonesii]|uniref:Glyoxalase/Bleomycin resistance protein/Dihydroxybiphenyl dioxygenase n=1 Tax=Fimicolochytrium jonesii TaxID=1396493 RepID=UPI0022FEF5B2|nr:Glyoxalase/Bleomycin resistance protein/Dihydroxybiphenyl dioxygenase [Fimicolochytrium jonesii]KAI8817152.1 Glyoxalase/Bleomycin resistance protein/Dihydroxybiphenyl dioxygenase [Fimicolochytrium jonesii]
MSLHTTLQQAFPAFIAQVFISLSSINIHIPAAYEIDHLCFRTSTAAEYDSYKAELASLGTLLTESIVGGRHIATYKLRPEHALHYTQTTDCKPVDRTIDVIELPSPKPGRPYPSGIEHVEVVVDVPLEVYRDRYKDVGWDERGMGKGLNRDLRLDFTAAGKEFSVKFHEQSLERVIEIELAALP